MQSDGTDPTASTPAAAEGCCTPPTAIDDAVVATDVRVLDALGNDTRYELVRRIAAARGDVCVCDLEAAVGVSQSAVSQALSRLHAAELVTRRKDGAWRYYDTTGRADALLATLGEVREADE